MEKKIPPLVMMRKNIEMGLWDKVGKEDVKKCPTILHHALLRYWDNTVFEKLLERGALVNERNHVDMTPLQFALNYKHNEKLILILLNHGASVNISSVCGRTPLHIAIVNNYSSRVIEKLLQCGASVNADDNFGMNALNLALTNKQCNIAVVEQLLKYGAKMKESINSKGFDEHVVTSKDSPYIHPLVLAVKLNLDEEVIRLLLKYQASAGKSLQQIISSLRRSHKAMLPYSIKMLTQYAALEYFEDKVSIFLDMFDRLHNAEYQDYAIACISELLHMKSCFVGENKSQTMYDFIIAKDDVLASIRENKSTITSVFSLLIKLEFPLYKNMILHQLGRRGLENLLLVAVESHYSPYSYCCWGSWLVISKHLSIWDLIDLIIAFKY